MKIYFLHIFFIYSIVFSQSEHTVNGKVVGEADNGPLPFATISVLDTNLSAETNLDGEFSIKLPLKTCVLRVDFIGSHPKCFLVHDTTIIIQDVKLKLDIEIPKGIPMYTTEEGLKLIEYANKGRVKASSDIKLGMFRLLQINNVSEVQKYISDQYLFKFEEASEFHTNYRYAYNEVMLNYFKDKRDSKLFADLEFINWENE